MLNLVTLIMRSGNPFQTYNARTLNNGTEINSFNSFKATFRFELKYLAEKYGKSGHYCSRYVANNRSIIIA